MKAKLYITRAIKISAFILLSALVIDAFYIEDKDTIDVAMIGSSEMYSGVSPALLYEKYGVTSFPYATASSTAAAMKTQIKEVERNQSPKLIVIEINCFLYGTDNEEKESSIRNYIDNVPLNGNKIEYIETTPAVRDLGRREFYFPTYLRGYKTTAQKLNVNEKIYNPTLPADETRNDLEPRYEVFLREFLDYCKEQKYDNLLFVRFPHIVKKETYKRFTRGNAAFDIISEYGFNYINFERDENVMTYTADDYYNYDHLNIYGSVKFTDYFGKIITEKYKVPKTVLDEKNTEESVDFWHKFYDYTEYRFKQNTKNKKIELWETNDLINKVEAYAAKQK